MNSRILIVALSASLLLAYPRPAAALQEPAGPVFYVSPDGNDGNPGTPGRPFRTLARARDAVRAVNDPMQSDVLVYLRGGTYRMDSPLQLTEEDSGTNGYDVVYQAFQGETPVLSGGTPITGWSPFDPAANIYRAHVGSGLQTRQLYVNGRRAVRARGADNPAGLTETPAGYSIVDPPVWAWRNPSDIEFVYQHEWTSSRCGVASISGPDIVMKQPCIDNARKLLGKALASPAWIENAYELLDAEGEWYLDLAAGDLYYKPRPGEDLATAEVVAARLETLVSGRGLIYDPIHNIQFKGITFAYATWLRPNSNEGFAELQANYTLVGPQASRSDRSALNRTPAAVDFRAAHAVLFERNVFAHLGAAGLALTFGSQDNVVAGNQFYDISGAAVHIGGVAPYDHHPRFGLPIVKDNTVANNYIHHVGVEFFGAPAVFVGYTDGTTITHNEIAYLPYTGISVGWGWGWSDPGGVDGYGAPTSARNNRITYNLIHDYMQVLSDGGGIYTLGSQPDSLIAYNFIHDQMNTYGAIYLDEGTRYYSVTDNVVASSPAWLYIWTWSIQNNTVRHNYSSVDSIRNNGRNNEVSDNEVVTGGDWPEAAQDIIAQAGLEAGYVDIKPDEAPANLAVSGSATASSNYNADFDARKANDDDIASGWSPLVNEVRRGGRWTLEVRVVWK